MNPTSDVQDALKSSSLLQWILVVLSFSLMAVLVLYSQVFPELSFDPSRWAQFGDFFGGLFNPLISLAALVGLFVVIRLTVETLSVSRETLRVTREEQEQNRDALRDQMAEKQFFDLLEAFLDIRKNVIHAKSGQSGVPAILSHFHSVLARVKNREIDSGNRVDVKRTFDQFHQSFLSERHNFSSAFNTFDMLVRQAYEIDGDDTDGFDIQFHKTLLVAVLTDDEKWLYCLYARSVQSKFWTLKERMNFCQKWLVSNLDVADGVPAFIFFKTLDELAGEGL